VHSNALLVLLRSFCAAGAPSALTDILPTFATLILYPFAESPPFCPNHTLSLYQFPLSRRILSRLLSQIQFDVLLGRLSCDTDVDGHGGIPYYPRGERGLCVAVVSCNAGNSFQTVVAILLKKVLLEDDTTYEKTEDAILWISIDSSKWTVATTDGLLRLANVALINQPRLTTPHTAAFSHALDRTSLGK